jgi:hypothetical protein
MSLNILRQQISEVEGVAGGQNQPGGLPTGVSELDDILPSNGIPRGRLTELLGTRGAGRTTLLRRIVQSVVSSGLWVAYIDASRTLAPQFWAHRGSKNILWVVRPPPADAKRGAWCADVLLRSGAFALVVLDGAPTLTRPIAVRLSRLARDSNSAFIVTSDERSAALMGGALRLRLRALREPRTQGAHPRRTQGTRETRGTHTTPALRRARERRFLIEMEKGGSPKHVEVSCAIEVESRLCAHPAVPDRRGVARGTRGKWGKFSNAALG